MSSAADTITKLAATLDVELRLASGSQKLFCLRREGLAIGWPDDVSMYLHAQGRSDPSRSEAVTLRVPRDHCSGTRSAHALFKET
jgi:hypothetical protein